MNGWMEAEKVRWFEVRVNIFVPEASLSILCCFVLSIPIYQSFKLAGSTTVAQ